MSVSVKLIHRTPNARVDGTSPVYVRITANRKSRFKSTGVYVAPKDWNAAKQQVRASHDIATALNAKLQRLTNEARTIALESTSASAVISALDGNGGSLTGYMEQFIEELDAKEAFWEWKKYRVTLGKLRECLGKDLTWKELDRPALTKFEVYLRQKRGNSPNTVRKELVRLRRVYKQAMRDGEIAPSDDPFLVYKMPKGQRVQRRKLSDEEIKALESLAADGKIENGSIEEAVLDAFLFAYYIGGMRFSDICRLKRVDISDSHVRYRMLKTGNPMSLPLHDLARRLSEKHTQQGDPFEGYLFPFLRPSDEKNDVQLRRRIASRNAQANTILKRLAKKAGIEPKGLTTHVARHSFADFARRKSNDLYAVSKSLGHRNLHTTEVYLNSLDEEAVDQLAEEIWK